MSRNFQDFHLQAKKIAGRSRLYQKIGLDRFDLELETQAAKELRVGNHGDCVRVAADWAAETLLDLRHVRDVIEMAVSEEEKFRRNAAGRQPFARSVRRVEQDWALRRCDEVAIRLENPSAERLVSHSGRT